MRKVSIALAIALFSASMMPAFAGDNPERSTCPVSPGKNAYTDSIFQRMGEAVSAFGRPREKKLEQESVFQQSGDTVKEYTDKTGSELIGKQ